MPNILSLSINDGTAAVTFTLDSVTEKSGTTTRRYLNRAASTTMAAEVVSLVWRGGGNIDTGAASCALELSIPVVLASTATTPATVSHTLRFANGKVYLPNRSTVTERDRLKNLAKNLLAHADIQSMISLAEAPRG